MGLLLLRKQSMHELAADLVERCKWVMQLNKYLSTLQSGSIAAMLTSVDHQTNLSTARIHLTATLGCTALAVPCRASSACFMVRGTKGGHARHPARTQNSDKYSTYLTRP